MLDSVIVVEYNIATMIFGGAVMFTIPELAMPKTRKVTTVCNGKREVWSDREEAKDFFIRQMITTEGEERERAECIYIQLMHGLEMCSDE